MTRATSYHGLVLCTVVCTLGLGSAVGVAAQSARQPGVAVAQQQGNMVAKEMQVVLRHRDAQATSHRYNQFTATRVRTEGDAYIIEGRLRDATATGGREEADVTITLRTTPQREMSPEEWDRLHGRPSE